MISDCYAVLYCVISEYWRVLYFVTVTLMVLIVRLLVMTSLANVHACQGLETKLPQDLNVYVCSALIEMQFYSRLKLLLMLNCAWQSRYFMSCSTTIVILGQYLSILT